MNHRHRKTLHSIFAHPLSGNIDFEAAMHVLEQLGATVEHKTGNRVGVTLNGHSVAFARTTHDLPKEEVMQIRKFLTQCGIDPAAYPV